MLKFWSSAAKLAPNANVNSGPHIDGRAINRAKPEVD